MHTPGGTARRSRAGRRRPRARINHTIVSARDAETSARWFAELFGLEPPEPLSHFWQVTTANGVGLDFASVGDGGRCSDIVGTNFVWAVSPGVPPRSWIDTTMA